MVVVLVQKHDVWKLQIDNVKTEDYLLIPLNCLNFRLFGRTQSNRVIAPEFRNLERGKSRITRLFSPCPSIVIIDPPQLPSTPPFFFLIRLGICSTNRRSTQLPSLLPDLCPVALCDSPLPKIPSLSRSVLAKRSFSPHQRINTIYTHLNRNIMSGYTARYVGISVTRILLNTPPFCRAPFTLSMHHIY